MWDPPWSACKACIAKSPKLMIQGIDQMPTKWIVGKVEPNHLFVWTLYSVTWIVQPTLIFSLPTNWNNQNLDLIMKHRYLILEISFCDKIFGTTSNVLGYLVHQTLFFNCPSMPCVVVVIFCEPSSTHISWSCKQYQSEVFAGCTLINSCLPCSLFHNYASA